MASAVDSSASRGSQLREWDCKIPACPVDQYKHVAGARIFRSHAADFDRFTFVERRNHLGHDALGLEWESNFLLQVVVPAHGLLFRSIGIHDNFVLDAVLSNWISLGLLCPFGKAA